VEEEKILNIIKEKNEILFYEKYNEEIRVFLKEEKIDYVKFRELYYALSDLGYLIYAFRIGKSKYDFYYLIKKIEMKNKDDDISKSLYIISLIFTIFSIFYFGQRLFGNNYFFILIFSISILLILLYYDLFYYLKGKKNKILISFSFLIPSILGSYGNIINLKDRIIDRIQKFEISFYPIIGGLVLTTALFVIGYNLSVYKTGITVEETLFPVPLIIHLIKEYFLPNSIIFAHYLFIISLLGYLILFVKLTPFLALDGGILADSILPNKSIINFIGLVVLLFNSITIFAVLLILIISMHNSKKLLPLNNVTELSLNKKILGSIMFIIWILLFPLNVNYIKLLE